MGVQSTIPEVNNFLEEVKSLVKSGDYDFVPRPKNNLTSLGINLKIALDIILNLTYKNYFNGPEQDNNPNFIGFIWEFGVDEEKYQIYIKLKIKDTSRGELLCIMGFHRADSPIEYSYK
ncbi:type II toxin-antitoxin system MqsR family toxin [Clostridium sp. BSD9I1]|uniref:type II toxin-antitoxin system MqsR family toxin n=1 Tax=Clostridium sp. BSD9I1 TaxID=2003589 RepID=UPI0016464325|nr:type II toxin-antitoxin system MqsR family toxin [Clostridium sp. BSD9I1]